LAQDRSPLVIHSGCPPPSRHQSSDRMAALARDTTAESSATDRESLLNKDKPTLPSVQSMKSNDRLFLQAHWRCRLVALAVGVALLVTCGCFAVARHRSQQEPLPVASMQLYSKMSSLRASDMWGAPGSALQSPYSPPGPGRKSADKPTSPKTAVVSDYPGGNKNLKGMSLQGSDVVGAPGSGKVSLQKPGVIGASGRTEAQMSSNFPRAAGSATPAATPVSHVVPAVPAMVAEVEGPGKWQPLGQYRPPGLAGQMVFLQAEPGLQTSTGSWSRQPAEASRPSSSVWSL